MKIAVVGGGAREHALGRALARTAEVVVTPGNDGMTQGEHPLAVSATSPEELAADLVVIGPEAPLVAGLADRLRADGVAVFGPGAEGARLEGSKAFMKEVAAAAGAPTAAYSVFDDTERAIDHLRHSRGPYVIKTDGLAAGKGVLVTADLAEAEQDVTAKLSGSAFGEAGRRVVIEEALFGEEASLLVLTDGRTAAPLPLARDYKRLGDGDRGPNTGGMGAHSPIPGLDDAVASEAMDRIIEPTLAEMRSRGIDYRGVLYAGLMLTEEGPKLVEFNVRLGDPEAEVVLPRLDEDLADLFYRFATGHGRDSLAVSSEASLCVVLASAGYPLTSSRGDVITGLEEASAVDGVEVLHAATRFAGGRLVTDGGRVIVVSALADSLPHARERAYRAAERIQFDGMQLRRDIAAEPVDAISVPSR